MFEPAEVRRADERPANETRETGAGGQRKGKGARHD